MPVTHQDFWYWSVYIYRNLKHSSASWIIQRAITFQPNPDAHSALPVFVCQHVWLCVCASVSNTSFSPQELIIALLSNAVAQFKKYKCPRMKSHLSE